jgi:hypothetical protein
LIGGDDPESTEETTRRERRHGAKCELRGRMFALSIIFVKEKENLPYFRVFDIAKPKV